MNRRSRQVLAVLAVTTALCADQVVTSSPALRPQVANLAGRIVNRLTQSFGRTVASGAQINSRTRALSRPAETLRLVPHAVAPTPVRPLLSPFQFRLPPPAL